MKWTWPTIWLRSGSSLKPPLRTNLWLLRQQFDLSNVQRLSEVVNLYVKVKKWKCVCLRLCGSCQEVWVSERVKGRRGRQRSFSKEAERQKRLSWALLQSSKSNRKKNVSVTKKVTERVCVRERERHTLCSECIIEREWEWTRVREQIHERQKC